MGQAEFEFDVDGLVKFQNLYRAIGTENRALPRSFKKAMMTQAKVAAKAAGAKVLEEPTPANAGHTGLRKNIQRGVGVEDKGAADAVNIRITTAMPEEDEAIIPRGMDGFRGWRHPVFGNRNNWVRQSGHFSWFMDTMQGIKEPLEQQLQQAMEDAAERIDKAAGG
ncbi:hypothetical protein [Nocardia nova]|uniref:hypothetical protein n=1 Tax=Nocardia nova TaxID=37330 RepID=UPI00273831D4|nr:hypothetical protein [Nocardia nova]